MQAGSYEKMLWSCILGGEEYSVLGYLPMLGTKVKIILQL